MLSHTFSYDECLHTSLKVAWKEEEILKNRDFDYSKRFLPNRLSGVDEISCLNEDEKRKLNQIIGNAYCHIFAYVEEYIIPQALEAAQRDIYGDETRLRALLRFAEDESKHQELFRRSTELFAKGFGVRCGLIPGQEDVARAVLWLLGDDAAFVNAHALVVDGGLTGGKPWSAVVETRSRMRELFLHAVQRG